MLEDGQADQLVESRQLVLVSDVLFSIVNDSLKIGLFGLEVFGGVVLKGTHLYIRIELGSPMFFQI